MKQKSFEETAQILIEICRDIKEYDQNVISRIEKLIKTDRRKFIKEFMKYTGVSQWDLPYIIFTEIYSEN